MPYFHAVAPAAASQDSPAAHRIGVLLVNLGTPDSPTYFAVQRYLREFLSDRRVIDTARAIWLPLLYGVVLPFRPLRTARNYRRIWMKEGSPLAVYSQRLTAKIDARLSAAYPDQVRVKLAMSYGNPNIAEVIRSFAEQGIEKLLVLPLYPQYCSSTTGSVIDGTNSALRRWRTLPETRVINDYHDDAGYIQVLSRKIREHWARAGGRSHLVFSYHGIPASYVAKGDPYQRQTETTTLRVVEQLALSDGEWSHCYQSRFGRVEWLKPYTLDKIKELADRGVRELTVASPSFAVDCLETLEEVAIEYRDRFIEWGGQRLSLVAGLNDDDDHVDALTNLIKSRLAGWL
ncbi:MAG TPA: ferrochelatase [Steroidobacteraceae bacterium]|jgi:ferrochelatase|nr:ferrochelatase [Steroidobacteraceae bacterium]